MAAKISPELFQQSVGNLLIAAGFTLVKLKREKRPFDFLFEDRDGRSTAILVSPDKIARDALESAADHLRFATRNIERFLLVTPTGPGRVTRSRFGRAFKDVAANTVWVSGDDLTAELGLGDSLDLSKPEIHDNLQVAAITSKIEKYLDGEATTERSAADISQVISTAHQRIGEMPVQFVTLRRQFPFRIIQRLTAKQAPLRDQLLIGGELDDVTVVMSDLKNFSTLVTRAGDAAVKPAMATYYKRARELVWDHGGVLDKFIGDAVMAIFNYPYYSTNAPMRAIAFARDLIAMGGDVLGALAAGLDEPVASGTRVGICSGNLSILDIGHEEIEVSFFGDTINLAARLEHNADTDCLLMDDRTHALVREHDPGLLDMIAPEDIALPPGAVKGQGVPVRAWQIAYRAMAEIEIVAEIG